MSTFTRRFRYLAVAATTMALSGFGLTMANVAPAAATTVASAEVFTPEPIWMLQTDSHIVFGYNGGQYPHTVTFVGINPTGGGSYTFSGTGVFDPNTAYTSDVSGTVNGTALTMHMLYTGAEAGYYLDVTGTIQPDGSVTEATFSDSYGRTLTWSMPAGSMVQTYPVQATVHMAQHLDTTNVAGDATKPSDNGPVWAYDNLSVKVIVFPAGYANQNGQVDIVHLAYHGSFKGFANPLTGNALTSAGSVDGTYEVTVSSSLPPDPANLPTTMNGPVSTTTMLKTLFGDPNALVEGGPYAFYYQNGNYFQGYDGTTSTITGFIRGR